MNAQEIINGLYREVLFVAMILLGILLVNNLVLLLNNYIPNRFDRQPKSKWMTALFYFVPLVIFTLLCVTAPFTSVSMVYPTTNVSTHSILETGAKLAATETELNMETEIQASMLPSVFPAFPDRTEFDIHASMDPAKEVKRTIC